MKILPSKALSSFKDRPRTESLADSVIRRVEDGLDYQPWWRGLLANHYSQEYQKAENEGRGFVFPEEETDNYVIQFFMFKTFGFCRDQETTQSMRWCDRNQKGSDGNMAKIRAMIVSGMTDAEIAQKFFTFPSNITAYVNLFFDIRNCLSSPYWMDTFLKPESIDLVANDFELRELVWLSFGYQKGPDLLDVLLSGKVDYLSKEESDAFFAVTRSAITSAGLMHVIGNLMKNVCGRSTEWERSLAIRAMESQRTELDKPDAQKWKVWFDGACEKEVFDADTAVGIRGGERAFLDAAGQMVTVIPPKTLTSTGNTISRSLISSRLSFGSNRKQRLVK